MPYYIYRSSLLGHCALVSYKVACRVFRLFVAAPCDLCGFMLKRSPALHSLIGRGELTGTRVDRLHQEVLLRCSLCNEERPLHRVTCSFYIALRLIGAAHQAIDALIWQMCTCRPCFEGNSVVTNGANDEGAQPAAIWHCACCEHSLWTVHMFRKELSVCPGACADRQTLCAPPCQLSHGLRVWRPSVEGS